MDAPALLAPEPDRPGLQHGAGSPQATRPADARVAAAPRTVRPEWAPLLAILHRLMDERRAVVIHVVAAARGAGTSTVAQGIAAAVAASGWNRVALLDAHPAPGAPGSSLLDTPELPELRTTLVEGSFVATGAFSSGCSPAARIGSVRDLYARLRATYGLTVVDCAPVLAAGSAAMLGAAADGTVLVVEAERTRIEGVKRARVLLDQVDAKLLGIVLNKSRPPRLLGRLR